VAGTARRLPTAEREEERRLNSRTLTIASVASATAAAVTSQLWIAGTWIAAALTPVLVALISEALHRPTERVARAWTAEREPRSSTPRRAQTATRAEPAAVTGSAGPVRVYRQTSRGLSGSERGRPTLSGRRIPWRAVLLTAAAAFAIAVATITVLDLVSGGSVGRGSGGTTLFGGSKKSSSTQNDSSGQEQQQQRTPEEQATTPDETPTATAPDEQTAPSDTAPTTPPAQTTPADPLDNATP
jgi:hypothetical protein